MTNERATGGGGESITRVCVVRAVGDAGYHAAVVERAGGGAEVTGASFCATPDDVARVVRDAACDSVVRVLPASCTVTRTVEVPSDDNQAAVTEALELLAEATLPASVPWWRRGAGVVAGGAGDGMHAAMIVGWIGGRGEEDGGLAEALKGVDIRCVPAGACLAALLQVTGGGPVAPAHGAATKGTVAFGDTTDGAVTAVAYGAAKSVARSSLVSGGAMGFSEQISAAFRTSSDRVAIDAAPTVARDEHGCVLAVDAATLDRFTAAVQGATTDNAWLAAYAPNAALGAALVTSGPDSVWHRLAGLTTSEPKEQAGPLAKTATAISRPNVAVLVCTLALVAILGGPVLASYLRMSHLETQANAYAAALGVNAATGGLTDEQRTRLYRELDGYRIPMTKVLADLGAAMPANSRREIALGERVTVEAGERFRVEGTAEPAALATQFLENLERSGVFSDVRVESLRTPTEPGADAEFVVSGEIDRPFFDARDLRDYAEYTAAAFIYGEITDEAIAEAKAEAERVEREAREAARRAREAEAGDTVVADADDAPVRNTQPDLATTPQGTGVSNTAGPRRTSREGSRRPAANEQIARQLAESGEDASLADDEQIERGRRQLFEGGSRSEQAAAAPEPIPEELTDEQIAAMDNLQAVRASLARRSVLRKRDDLEPDVKARLEDEERRLMDRAREAKAEANP